MDLYRYKCSDCGSTRFEKTENGYKCKYCGNIQDIIRPEESKPEKEEPIKDIPEVVVVEKDEKSEDKSRQIKISEKFKSALIHLIIVVFGGWFGLHKFLKGEIFWGIIYAITGGIFGIFYVIDIITSVFELLGSLKVGENK